MLFIGCVLRTFFMLLVLNPSHTTAASRGYCLLSGLFVLGHGHSQLTKQRQPRHKCALLLTTGTFGARA